MADTVNDDGFRFGVDKESCRKLRQDSFSSTRDPFHSRSSLFDQIPVSDAVATDRAYSWSPCVTSTLSQSDLAYEYPGGMRNLSFDSYTSSPEDLAKEGEGEPDMQSIFGQSLSASVVFYGDDFQDKFPLNFPSTTGILDSEIGMDTASYSNAASSKHWNPGPNTHNPFEVPELLSSSLESRAHSSSSAKPTYSEVAKLLKGKLLQRDVVLHQDELEGMCKKTVAAEIQMKVPRTPTAQQDPQVAFSARTRDGFLRCEPTVVLPDSRYGLDQFEVQKKEKDGRSVPQGLGDVLDYEHVSGQRESLDSASSDLGSMDETSSVRLLNNMESRQSRDQKLNSVVPDSASLDRGKVEKPFFDARRIFQSNIGRKIVKNEGTPSPVLNNGVPTPTGKPVHHHSSGYINNDLRDIKKWPNQPASSDGSKTQDTACRQKTKVTYNGQEYHQVDQQRQHTALQSKFFSIRVDRKVLNQYARFSVEKVKWFMHQLWTLLVTVVVLVLVIVSGFVHLLVLVCSKIWNVVSAKFWEEYGHSWQWRKFEERLKKIGLDENIKLPATGEEAMRRLLGCQGKDPYSILGLCVDSSDDDIKKYYKRQAILVHPDKNQQPGAEEAFKILGHAFETIGEPEKRKKYDTEIQEADKVEAAMGSRVDMLSNCQALISVCMLLQKVSPGSVVELFDCTPGNLAAHSSFLVHFGDLDLDHYSVRREFADLLSKLEERFREEANLMKCEKCGNKHRRILVDIPSYRARFCDRCSSYHPAKEGDVWAQTSMLGFLWHYYACMEGSIYNITEWVICQKNAFRDMQPDAHHVFYRIAAKTGKNHCSRKTGEADLDNFLSKLFTRARHHDTQQQQQHHKSSSNSADCSSSTGAKRGKKKRKKKRR